VPKGERFANFDILNDNDTQLDYYRRFGHVYAVGIPTKKWRLVVVSDPDLLDEVASNEEQFGKRVEEINFSNIVVDTGPEAEASSKPLDRTHMRDRRRGAPRDHGSVSALRHDDTPPRRSTEGQRNSPYSRATQPGKRRCVCRGCRGRNRAPRRSRRTCLIEANGEMPWRRPVPWHLAVDLTFSGLTCRVVRRPRLARDLS